MITFERGKVVGNVQLPGAVLANKIRMIAVLDQKTAEALGVGWALFDAKGVIRQGPMAIELDNVYDGARVTHEIPRIGKLELVAVSAEKFKVFRQGDGKKKPTRMMVAFTVKHTGAPFELQEHMIKCGKGEGIITVQAPEQQQLDMGGGEKKEPAATDKPDAPLKLDYAGKGVTANITVVAQTDGFTMTCRATSPTKRLEQGVPDKFASEQEALEHGAATIQTWAGKAHAGAIRPQKKEALKLVEWCAAILSRNAIAHPELTSSFPERYWPTRFA